MKLAPRGSGPHYARARAEALPCRSGAFDAVVVCLALEHVDAFEVAVDEVARVLEPGGRFVLLLCHPLLQAPGSGWVDDQTVGEHYWRIGAYLTTTPRSTKLRPACACGSCTVPLSRYVHAMGQAGLLIDDMEEPAPPRPCSARSGDFPQASTIPRVLLLRPPCVTCGFAPSDRCSTSCGKWQTAAVARPRTHWHT